MSSKSSTNQPFITQTPRGYSKKLNDDGSIRYTFSTPDGVDLVYEEIEKSGCIVLDEDDDGNWIEVISPQILVSNINQDDLTQKMSRELQNEIDKEIMDKISEWIEEQNKNKRGEDFFEQWKESQKNAQ